MIRTQISMTEEQAAALQRLAAARDRSQAALLREALDWLIDDDERRRRVARARRVAGLGHSGAGTSNIAEDHDAALEEAFLA